VVVVVLAMTNLIAHFTTPWASIATVPAAAVGLLILVRSRGLGWAELGLGREHWKSGAGYAVAAVALVLSVIAIGALLPLTRPMFMNNNYATISGALIASMIIIPLQTVIPEELAFRGARKIFGSGLRGRRRGIAAVRPVAYRHVTADQQQCRFTWIWGGSRASPGWCWRWPPASWCLHLAAPTQRQPDRPDRTALVAQWAGRAGGRPRVALVDLTAERLSER
jgi:hypothetical protein